MGVDVGGKRKGFDVALIDDHRVCSLASGLDRNAVVRFVALERPMVVAIDSPRCCASQGKKTRDGELQVNTSICGIRWTPDSDSVRQKPYYAWILEGLTLFEALAKQKVEVIEVFPTASWTRWFGKRGSQTRAKWSRRGLELLGLEGTPSTSNQDRRTARELVRVCQIER